ncbi:MAG TPA: hypothetical protein VGM05_06285 [Planctomycetaceae bacterium]|jgi:TolB protein
MPELAAEFSRRQFMSLAAGMIGSGIPVAAVAAPPRPEGKIAFVSGSFGDGRGKIWIMLPDGSARRPLTENVDDPGENSPAWSPDGKRIAFSALRDGRNRIYLRDSDGKNEACLTPDASLAEDYEHPTWSPDAKTIAFCAYPGDRKNAHICVMSAAGADQRQLTFGNHYDWSPCFSPDGRRIVFESTRDGNREIYTINVDGSNPVNLTTNSQTDHHPACSPDGRRIAFMTRRDQESAEICVMNPDGSNPINLTHHPARDSEPAWSPCSNWLVFTRVERGSAQAMDIFIMKSDGSERVNLTRSPGGRDNWAPSWRRNE